MTTISDFFRQYSDKIDYLDLELILSRVLGRPREFVLAHPEYKIPATDNLRLTTLINRRMRHEPLAHILGEKEFYGLKFKVNKNALIPRPETELLVDITLNNLQRTTNDKNIILVDVGTGSGNIIISIVKCLLNHKQLTTHYNFFGIDISKKALAVARKNAKFYKVGKKIKFLRGNLLKPVFKKLSVVSGGLSVFIIANLPYLSPALYRSSQISVKMYEPKKALLSQKHGLLYYDKLLKQTAHLIQITNYKLPITLFLEFSPEQKNRLQKLIKKYFPRAKINPHTKDSHRNCFGVRVKFYKDLAGKWRVCEIKVNTAT